MTASRPDGSALERRDGLTARRRAGDSMRRGISTVSRPPVETEDRPAVTPSDRPGGETAKRQTVWSKYTVKFRPEVAAEFDAIALRARRRLNRRVDKSEIVTALIRLVADDASLADQLFAELEH